MKISAMFSELKREQKEAIGLLQVGTFLEYFDLMLYIHMSVLLNELFFPKTDPHTAQLLTALSFSMIFVLRPFGALIFGYIGDTIGRKATVVITTLMMALSCLTLFILPTYAQIGIAASWIMLICRALQGLASMGEITGAELYLSESIKRPAVYPLTGLLMLSLSLGGLVALGVAWLATHHGFNWRYAFLAGAMIALVGAVARTRLRETPEFVNAKYKLQRIVAILTLKKRNRHDILLIKLFDRLHNIQTLQFKSLEKQRKIALETLHNFVPLAASLEIEPVREALMAMCLSVLKPSSLNENEYELKLKPTPRAESYEHKLMTKLEALNTQREEQIDLELVQKAINYAKEYHGEQKRLSGEPYYTHPLEVAYLLAHYVEQHAFSSNTMVAAILHDIVEDTPFTLEMLKAYFNKDVAAIVYGLTRIRIDKKLSSAELLATSFNSAIYSLKTEKTSKRLTLAYFWLQCSSPACFYLLFGYCANILQTKFQFTAAAVIGQNLFIQLVEFLMVILLIFLSYKIYPLKILKVLLLLFFSFMLICPYLLTQASTPNAILLIQFCIAILGVTTFPADPIFYSHFPIFKRFTYTSFMYALSRAIVHLLTSFGVIYLTQWYGHYGLLIVMLPILLGFGVSLNYFEKLEKEKGYISSKRLS